MGQNTLNGILVLVGGAAACLAAVPFLAGLGLAWAVNKQRPRAFGRSWKLALGNLVLLVIVALVMDDQNWTGPRTPAWVDMLGLVWFLAYIAASIAVLRYPRPRPHPSPESPTP